jgi:nucleoside-diphosphate-sugar epimerase
MMTTPICLLIAGCGDLGMRVAQRVLQNPTNLVWGLKRTRPDDQENTLGFTWFKADLSNPESMKDLPAGITHILFSAAPHVRTESDYRAVYFDGLRNVVQNAYSSALKRVLFISSTAVYGDHGDEWVNEDTPVNPKNFNGRVLLEAEQWLSTFGREHALTTLSLRLSGIYGPGRIALLEKLKLGQVGAPSSAAHWSNRIHIDDAAAAVVHLMGFEHPQSTYLITDSTPLPMRTLYEALAQQVGGPVPPVSESPAFVGSKRLSNARIRETGFVFQWPDSRDGYRDIIQAG